jgi:hypothetical protein
LGKSLPKGDTVTRLQPEAFKIWIETRRAATRDLRMKAALIFAADPTISSGVVMEQLGVTRPTAATWKRVWMAGGTVGLVDEYHKYLLMLRRGELPRIPQESTSYERGRRVAHTVRRVAPKPEFVPKNYLEPAERVAVHRERRPTVAQTERLMKLRYEQRRLLRSLGRVEREIARLTGVPASE